MQELREKYKKVYLVHDPEKPLYPMVSINASTWENDPQCIGKYIHTNELTFIKEQVDHIELGLTCHMDVTDATKILIEMIRKL